MTNNEFIPFLKAHLKHDNFQITPLFGQASARQYFRVHQTDSDKTYVLMFIPGGFLSPAEEITKTDAEAPKEYPFLNIQKYLNGLEIPVPDVLAFDQQQGLMLLSDLGDQSLENLLDKADQNFFLFYYQKVIETLIELQLKTQKAVTKNCLAYHKRFDADLLAWEFNHFLEYAIEDRLGLKVSNEERSAFEKAAKELSQIITTFPQGFTHRDFQSRNLMFHGYDFYLIDFQDALVGPVIYDLVGLLRDSYIDFQQNQLTHLIDYYCRSLPEDHAYHDLKKQIQSHFYLVALQRKMKDTGRFQFIKTVKHNDKFLAHVPLSLRYVKEAFEELLEGQAFSYEPELQKQIRTQVLTLKNIAQKYLAELQ